MAELNLHFTGETITDPLYGQIPLTLVEDELRKTVEFGRLMKIKQLGSARYVYPSANHTRESHSFGCMYLIDKITRVLAEKLEEKSTPVIESRDLENFRVAALLHDLGHGPFSHSIESVLERNSIFRPSVKTIDGSSRPAVRHEDFTIDFLLSNGSEVSRVLDKHMIKKQDIASLISGKYNGKLRNFGQLLSSDVDVDRIDYVLRDMYHIGANWKDIININSLMSSFDTEFSDYYDSYIIYVTESQMANVDLFLHLRSIFIFTLPLNQRVHCSDFMLARAMEYALEKEEDPKKKVREIFTKMNDDDLENYLSQTLQAKALLEKIRRCELLKTYRIRIRELEPEYRYNFFKLSKEFELHRSFEKKIKNLLDTRLLLDNRTLTEYNLIPDFNFPEPFPLKLFVRGTLRDYHLYFDYSPLIRGMARNTFDESVVLLFYDEEIIGKYLETMSDVIIEDTLAEISSKATISDIDRMLLLFSTLDKLGRMHFKIEDPEWTGPFQKGWAKLSDLVKRLKENGFPFSYKFDFKAGKREYDEDMWRDLLKLVACGLIYERLTPALLTKGARKAYRERNDFQLTPFGRRYVERYLGKTNNIAKQFEDAIQKEWENAMQMQEQIRNKQKTEEALLDGIANARANGDVKKQRESQTELEKLVQEIRDLKEKIPFMVDYREDVF